MPKKMNNLRVFIFSILIISFFSCNRDDINEITAIEITHNNQAETLLVGDTFVFQVRANNSTDVTTECQFKVDNVTIVGNTFTTSDMPKEYTVQAFYNDIVSEPIKVYGAEGYPKNVLIEDYTGTWCGNCPRVSYAIEQVKEQTERVVPVAVHISDEFTFDGAQAINDAFGISSYPNARLDRIHKWTAPEPNNIAQAVGYTGIAPLGLAISSTLVGSALQIECKVGFSEDINEAINLVVYILEDGLHADQENYTTYYGGDAVLTNFEHKDVLRAIVTDYLGNNIPAGETLNENTFTTNYDLDVSTIVSNQNNIKIVAFVVNTNTKEVLNVRLASVGEDQDLQ